MYCRAVLPRSWVRISLEAKYLQHLSAQLIHYIPYFIYIFTHTFTRIKNNKLSSLQIASACTSTQYISTLHQRIIHMTANRHITFDPRLSLRKTLVMQLLLDIIPLLPQSNLNRLSNKRRQRKSMLSHQREAPVV